MADSEMATITREYLDGFACGIVLPYDFGPMPYRRWHRWPSRAHISVLVVLGFIELGNLNMVNPLAN